MRVIIIIALGILVNLVNSEIIAQNRTEVDSLLNELELAKTDTLRIRLLIDLSEFYQKSDNKKAEYYGVEAVVIAEKTGQKQFKVRAYRNLGFTFFMGSYYVKSAEYFQKAYNIYKTLNDKSGISASLHSLGSINLKLGNYAIAKDYFAKSFKISKEICDTVMISKCYRNLGIVEANLSNYEQAIEFFYQELMLARKIGNSIAISNCLSNIGVIYNYQGNHSKSIEYQEKALQECMQSGDKQSISSQLVNLGVAYDDQSSYDKALKCYIEALELKKDMGDRPGISMCFNNIGEIYKDKGDYSEAIEYYEKSLNIDIELNDESGTAICLLNIGNVHFLQNDYNKAFEYYQKSLALAEKCNEKRIMANVLNCMGELLLEQKRYQQAIENFKKASVLSNEIGDESEKAKAAFYLGAIFITQNKFNEAIAHLNMATELHSALGEKGKVAADHLKIAEAYFLKGNNEKALEYCSLGLDAALVLGLKEEMRTAYELLSKTYASKLNFEKAYQYSVLFKQTHDSIFTMENQKQLHTIENRFEIERKQQEIELQNAKLAKQEIEIQQQQFKQNVLLIGIIAVLGIIVFIIIAYARIRKANYTILNQKDRIEESNEELNQSNEELSLTIATVNQQKQQIERTNKEITDSIYYAQYIQKAILPKIEVFSKFFVDYFVLYKPKDIVSGDFYWTTELEGRTIIAAADCTGHGVPGAFMSMLGVSFLNDIINKEYITHPAVILKRLRKEVIHALNQKGKLGEQRDGMDISLCSIDFKTGELQFSGANSSLYIIRAVNSEPVKDALATQIDNFVLYEIKGDKMPIAIYEKMDKFTLIELPIFKGDRLYLFSDGYADQFGGDEGKRLKLKPFKKILLENCEKPMENQMAILEEKFNAWRQEYDQIDDVMVLGFLI